LNYTQRELEEILAKAKSGHVLTSAEYAKVNQITEIKQQVEELKNNTSQIATYQTKVDNNLNTTNKSIVDAINELLSKVETNSSMISTAKKKLIDAIGAPLVEESTFNAIEQTLNDLTTTLQNALTDLGIATLTTDRLQALIEKVKTIEIPEVPDISGLLETFRDILSANGVAVSNDEELASLITKTEALIRSKNEDIEEYKTTVNDLNKRIDNLNESITELERDIETLQEENTELNNNITAANETINELNTEKVGLNSTINSLNEEIRGLNDTINELRNNIGNSATDNAALQQRVSELESRVTELESEITELEQQVQQSGSTNTGLNNRIQELESEVASLQQQLNQSNSSNSTLQGNVAELNNRIQELEAEVDSLNKQLTQSGSTNTELQETITSLRTRVSELETQLNQAGSSNTALQETVTSLNTRISELESQVSTLESTVGAITAQNQALINEINGLTTKVKQLVYSNIPYHYISLHNDKPFDLAARKPMGKEFEWSINSESASSGIGIKQDTLLYGYEKGLYKLDAKCKTTGYVFEKVLTVVVCNTASIEPGDSIAFEEDSIMNSLDGENEYLLYLDKEGDVITQNSFGITLTKDVSQSNVYGKDHISMHFSDTSICDGSINVGSADTYYLITGKKAGTCFVTIESHGLYGVFRGLSFKVTVKYTVHAESIKLNVTRFICNDLEPNDGVAQLLTATVLPEDTTNKTISWSSSDENVATVNSSGKISIAKDSTTGMYRNGYGYCEITATCGKASAVCKVYLLKNDRFYIFSENDNIGINEDIYKIKETKQNSVTILQQNIPRQSTTTKNLILSSRQSVNGSFFYTYPTYSYMIESKEKIDFKIFDKLEIDFYCNKKLEGHSYEVDCFALSRLYQEYTNNDYIQNTYKSFNATGVHQVSLADYKNSFSVEEARLELNFLTRMDDQVNGATGAGMLKSTYVCFVRDDSFTGTVSSISEGEEENNTIVYIKGSEINE
jgi:septal ring factor EnvC (AmiA/AmiB activator)